MNKGSDRATALLQQNQKKKTRNPNSKNGLDEIEIYLECRYISACEALWRIYQFDIHYRELAIEHLSFHLPNKQQIIFTDNDDLQIVIARPTIEQTKLTEWMSTNSMYPDARDLTYADFPLHLVWNQKRQPGHGGNQDKQLEEYTLHIHQAGKGINYACYLM